MRIGSDDRELAKSPLASEVYPAPQCAAEALAWLVPAPVFKDDKAICQVHKVQCTRPDPRQIGSISDHVQARAVTLTGSSEGVSDEISDELRPRAPSVWRERARLHRALSAVAFAIERLDAGDVAAARRELERLFDDAVGTDR